MKVNNPIGIQDLPVVTEWNAKKDCFLINHPDQRERNDFFEMVVKTIHFLENGIGRAFAMTKEEEDKDNYNNITVGYYKFLSVMSDAIKFQKNRLPEIELDFVDLGCGLGTKGAMAKFLGVNKRFGVDKNKDYLKIASHLANHTIEADLFDYTKSEEFKSHNLVYWYTPIRDQKKMAKLLKRIFKNAGNDAVLFPASRFDVCLMGELLGEFGWSERLVTVHGENNPYTIYYKNK